MTIKQALKLADSRSTLAKTTGFTDKSDLAWAVRVLAGAYRREKLISKKYKGFQNRLLETFKPEID